MTKERWSVCRICLREGPHHVSILEGRRVRMLALVRGAGPTSKTTLTSKSKQPLNNLPMALCSDCDHRLSAAAAFISLCRRSEKRLMRARSLRIPFNRLHKSVQHKSVVSETPSTLSNFKPAARSFPNIECDVCGLQVKCKSALIVHFRSHSGEKPNVCPYCNLGFAQSGTLSEHIKRKHSNINVTSIDNCFACEYCGKQFVKKGDMIVHLRIHTKEKPYECSICSSRFTQKGTLNQHMMLHTGERPFSCHTCEKKFIAKTSLQRHLTVHSTERKYICTACKKAFKSNATLKKHVSLVHLFKKTDICDKCGMTFTNKSNLKSHLKTVHSESSGNCDVCKKHFSKINDHMRVHTGETPFSCHLCDKSFALKRSLNAHINKHENASKYICNVDECNKRFAMQCTLKFHILKFHSNHTPHVCQYCSKGFYRLSDLSKHIKSIHYGTDPDKF